MDAKGHKVEDYLIWAFARYMPLPQVIVHFREQFGRDPTPDEIHRCDLGKVIYGKRQVFRENARVREFIRQRELYNDSIKEIPIHNPTWRMHQYQTIYNRILPGAMESGNFGRCMDVLTLAAKDGAGGFSPNKTVNVDNRTINLNSMSDEELNKKLKNILEQFNVNLPDMPIIETGDHVIEHEETGND